MKKLIALCILLVMAGCTIEKSFSGESVYCFDGVFVDFSGTVIYEKEGYVVVSGDKMAEGYFETGHRPTIEKGEYVMKKSDCTKYVLGRYNMMIEEYKYLSE